MNEADWRHLQTLFHGALEKESADRQTFLETACGEDRELLQRLTGMLRADEEAKSLLYRDLPCFAADMIDGTLHDSAQFEGPEAYRLKRILGEGGMGVVWLAERKDAGNPVAIKFLPNALMSTVRRQRFAAEIKTLAKLKHAFIARLYDAGALADGTPWFAMEYVEGVALNEYCKVHQLTPMDCLRLMRTICEAVQYAHSQEIIHRDLKPSNILVEPNGTPKLLDFGIARELQGLQQEAGLTRPGLRMFTPEYAAPEWIEDGTLGFSTDVYSLGVILSEMLHGERPGPQAKQAKSDIDRLCLKARQEDPVERYASVEAFARDIDHYLSGEPLDAHPYSVSYQVSRFLARNKKPVLAALLVLVFVLTLAGVFGWRLAQARSAAAMEAARTQRVEQFMLGLFEGGDRGAGPSNNLRVITLLDHGVLDAQMLSHEPAIQGEVFRTLGRSYQALGEFQKAQSLFESALGLKRAAFGRASSDFAESELDLGLLQIDEAQLPEAEKTIRESISAIGKYHPSSDPRLARATSALAQVFFARGEYKQAISLFNAAIKIQSGQRANKADLASSMSGLADSVFGMGEYLKAAAIYQSVLELHKQLYGEHHPRVAEDLRNLGNVQTQIGRYAAAEQLFRQGLEIDQAWYGASHPETANMLSYVGQSLMYQEKYAEAEPIYQRALECEEQVYGKSHPKVALILTGLTGVHVLLGKGEAAIAEGTRAFEIYRTTQGEEHINTLIALTNLAGDYMELKQYSRAEPLFRRVIALFSKIQSPEGLNVGVARMKLGRTLLGEGRLREANTETLASYEILSKVTEPSNGWIQADRRDLIKEYTGLHEPEKAIRYQTELATYSR